MFQKAEKQNGSWVVFNDWGHGLLLPVPQSFEGREVAIGTIGTRRRTRAAGDPTANFAALLRGLARPVYLIDARRSGIAARMSWGPLEFGTLVPEALPRETAYSYAHLPCLAPSTRLLERRRKLEFASWEAVRAAYLEETTSSAFGVAQAFVEAAAARGGLAIFLGTEAYQPHFDRLSAGDKLECYGHRFSLARAVGRRIRADHPGALVSLVHLDPVDFQREMSLKSEYTPAREAV
jgi:hypothetical protein